MTEACCIVSALHYPEHDDTGYTGRFLPNIDVKLLADDGIEINTFNTPGELSLRGPTIPSGYAGVPRERDFDNEGYFRTGDVVYCDEKTGLWYVVDRKKELIKARGFQVAPKELEGVLLEHDGIADVAVIGVKITNGDEAPRAYVVRKKGVERSERDVQKWVEGKLSRYKWLTGGVRFSDSIPKSPSGKILKKVLRDGVKREEGAKL